MSNIGKGYGILKNAGIDIDKIPPERVWQEVNKLNGTDAERNRLKEKGIKKSFKMSNSMKEYYADRFSDYTPRFLDIDKLIKDNNLENDEALANRRRNVWGDSIKNYKIDEDKLRYEENYPILVTESDGKLKIEDGMHRIMALKNAGYDEVEILTRKSK